jgi:hypothetical protein
MKANVDAVKAMRNVTMTLHIKRGTELRWRVWLGGKLLALAARVMNCHLFVLEGDE